MKDFHGCVDFKRFRLDLGRISVDPWILKDFVDLGWTWERFLRGWWRSLNIFRILVGSGKDFRGSMDLKDFGPWRDFRGFVDFADFE